LERLQVLVTKVDPEFEFNIVVLGSRKVGKTSLIQSVVNGNMVPLADSGLTATDDSYGGGSRRLQQSLEQELVRHNLDMGHKKGSIPVTFFDTVS